MTQLAEKNAAPLTIRGYEPDDREAVLSLHVRAMIPTGAYRGPGPWEDDLAAIELTYGSTAGGIFLVGCLDRRIVAMGGLRRSAENRAEIKRLRVDPAFQGLGYGREILNRLEARAREVGYEAMHLDTSDRQHSAHQLYRRAGFTETARRPDGAWSAVTFEKRL